MSNAQINVAANKYDNHKYRIGDMCLYSRRMILKSGTEELAK